MRGFLPKIRQFVLLKEPKTAAEAITHARLAQAVQVPDADGPDLVAAIDMMTTKMDTIAAQLSEQAVTVNTFAARTEPEQRARSPSFSDRQVRFQQPNTPPSPRRYMDDHRGASQAARYRPPEQYRGNQRRGDPPTRRTPCGNCGKYCRYDNCYAKSTKCMFCSRLGHVISCCRTRQRQQRQGYQQ